MDPAERGISTNSEPPFDLKEDMSRGEPVQKQPEELKSLQDSTESRKNTLLGLDTVTESSCNSLAEGE